MQFQCVSVTNLIGYSWILQYSSVRRRHELDLLTGLQYPPRTRLTELDLKYSSVRRHQELDWLTGLQYPRT